MSSPTCRDMSATFPAKVWVVGAFFAGRNAPALGGILNQQGVGSSTWIFSVTSHPPKFVENKPMVMGTVVSELISLNYTAMDLQHNMHPLKEEAEGNINIRGFAQWGGKRVSPAATYVAATRLSDGMYHGVKPSDPSWQ